tara:strand:- start:92 stop:511 length:420 start_codon:yes stop_codon:yes gene_type:complete
MATTTATLTLSSADLTGDALSLSTTATLTKANTVTGLDQTTGVGRKTTASNSLFNLFEGSEYTAAKAHKVYVRNTSTVATEYFTISIGDSGGTPEEIGRLYAGDWMFIPWSAHDAANDICVTPSESTTMTLEYMLIFEA